MKKTILALLLAACCLSGLALADGEDWIPEPYRPILDLARRGAAGDETAMDDERFNDAYYYLPRESEQTVGWMLMDLDGDSAMELILGLLCEDPGDESFLLDIWTIRDGEAVLLGRGWERWRMYLTVENGGVYGLYFEGADSAYDSVFAHSLIVNGEAVDTATIHAVFDPENETAPAEWTLNDAAIGEEEARALIEGWAANAVVLGLSPVQP